MAATARPARPSVLPTLTMDEELVVPVPVPVVPVPVPAVPPVVAPPLGTSVWATEEASCLKLPRDREALAAVLQVEEIC